VGGEGGGVSRLVSVRFSSFFFFFFFFFFFWLAAKSVNFFKKKKEKENQSPHTPVLARGHRIVKQPAPREHRRAPRLAALAAVLESALKHARTDERPHAAREHGVGVAVRGVQRRGAPAQRQVRIQRHRSARGPQR
jgi:hypothetical protein